MVNSVEDFLAREGSTEMPGANLRTLLDNTVASACNALRANACGVMLLDEAHQTLTLKACLGLYEAAVDAVRLPKDKGIEWKIIREKKTLALDNVHFDPDFVAIPEAGGHLFKSLLGVPIMDNGACIGTLCVQQEDSKEFSREEIESLEKIAFEAAKPIKAAWLFERLRDRTRALTRLNEMSKLINSTNNMDEILAHIVRFTGELTDARTKVIWLTGSTNEISSRHIPESTGDEQWMLPVREGIVQRVAETRRMVKVDDVRSENDFEGLERVSSTSVICHPMVFDNVVEGVILLGDRRSGLNEYFSAFSGEEAEVLEYIAQTAAQAISRVKTHARLESTAEANRQNVRELSILFQLSLAMQRTINMDDLLRVILSCVTVGKGLGFNRAILFLENESADLLHGMMGVGPDSGEDAERIWSGGEELNSSADLVQWLLNRDPYEIENSDFNKMAKSLRIPLFKKNIIGRAFSNRVAINVRGVSDFAEGDAELVSGLNCSKFAIVPLVARDLAMGAIVVDNFYNDKEITDNDIKLLTRFAAPAAWAIENIKLFERLSSVNKELMDMDSNIAHVERLSALGEVSAEMAHELKNPLVTIGGFARRLLKRIPESKMEVRYVSIIVQEVERLEGLLRNTLDVSRETPVKRESVDLNRIVKDAADFYWRVMYDKGIKAEYSLYPNLKKANIDQTQIRQALINLILNSIEAMSCDKHGIPKILTLVTEPAPNHPDKVRLIISDSGGGIAERDYHDVFNPFFTTKPHGTGLGLSLCKKLVMMSYGSLKIDNKLGDGVTFTITLPCENVTGDTVGG